MPGKLRYGLLTTCYSLLWDYDAVVLILDCDFFSIYSSSHIGLCLFIDGWAFDTYRYQLVRWFNQRCELFSRLECCSSDTYIIILDTIRNKMR